METSFFLRGGELPLYILPIHTNTYVYRNQTSTHNSIKDNQSNYMIYTSPCGERHMSVYRWPIYTHFCPARVSMSLSCSLLLRQAKNRGSVTIAFVSIANVTTYLAALPSLLWIIHVAFGSYALSGSKIIYSCG